MPANTLDARPVLPTTQRRGWAGLARLIEFGSLFELSSCTHFRRSDIMRRLLAMFALAILAVPALADEKKDIVDTAAAADNFKTLVAAVKAAGLVETLKGEGPFTVLAPTDEAFAKLPEGTLDSLLKPENKDKLVAVLKYHVIPSKAMAADVVQLDGKEVKTAEGSSAKVTVKDGTVSIGDAKVVKTDIECTNGVIHVIDKVLLPPANK
jgi:uncharacterized surface protein with fasciclin (FAS1) repeats